MVACAISSIDLDGVVKVSSDSSSVLDVDLVVSKGNSGTDVSVYVVSYGIVFDSLLYCCRAVVREGSFGAAVSIADASFHYGVGVSDA